MAGRRTGHCSEFHSLIRRERSSIRNGKGVQIFSFAHCVPFSFFFFCNQGARLVHSLLVLFFKPSGFVVFSFFVLLFFLFPPSSSLSLSPYGFSMFQSPVTSTRAPPSAAFCASASNGRLRLLRLLRTRFPRLRPLAPAPVPLPSFPCP